MPKEVAVAEDTTDKVPEGAETDEAKAGTAQEVETKPKLVFGKYKTEADAEKGYKELERKLTELSADKERLGREAELKGLLEKLAEQRKEPEQNRHANWEDFAREVAESFSTDPGVGVKKILQAASNWAAEEGKRVGDLTATEIKTLRAELARVQERVEKNDADYQQNRELVDELVANGVTMAKAKELARKLRAEQPAPPEAVERVVPSAAIPTRTTVRATEKPTYLTKEERALFKAQGSTDAELDQMEREYQERIKPRGVR